MPFRLQRAHAALDAHIRVVLLSLVEEVTAVFPTTTALLLLLLTEGRLASSMVKYLLNSVMTSRMGSGR